MLYILSLEVICGISFASVSALWQRAPSSMAAMRVMALVGPIPGTSRDSSAGVILDRRARSLPQIDRISRLTCTTDRPFSPVRSSMAISSAGVSEAVPLAQAFSRGLSS